MNCLPVDALERLALGFLADGAPERLHATACDACGRRLAALEQEHAALARAARTIPRPRAGLSSAPMAFFWKPLAWALGVHAVFLGAVLAFFPGVLDFPEDDALVQLNPSVGMKQRNGGFTEIERPRDVFERKGMPRDEAMSIPTDEPAIFFPEARESEHLESADTEDYRSMKSESRDFLSYIKGEAGGYRGRQANPGIYDTMSLGVGGGSAGRTSSGRSAPRPVAKAKEEPARGDPEGAAGMTFKDQGTNPWMSTADEALSTFGLDVDTASYTKIRAFLLGGGLPPKEAVRIEECLNYFRYADPRPTHGKFAIRLEAAPSPFTAGRHLLRIALQSKELKTEERKRVNLTFVIDVSGSMAAENRLGLVKRSLELLVDQLRPDDRIGVVVYGSSGRKLLDPTPVAKKRIIQQVIAELRTEGATNLEAGVDIGYELAAKCFDPEAANRVVICTDGVANNGVTDPVVLVRNVKEKADKGIWLSVFGFGMGNYNDHLMMTLADKGNGNYAYIDDFQEAKRAFTEKLCGLFDVAAQDAKIQVEFNAAAVEGYRLIGYEKRRLENQDFRNDKIDAGELSAGHHVTALYELALKADGQGRLATVRLRYRDTATKEVIETEDSLARSQLRKSAAAASASYRLAAAVAQFAEILRDSAYARASLAAVLEQAQTASIDLDRPVDAEEFVGLIKRTMALRK